ncbi:MAG: hypothetical protein BWY92_01251 [Firmicutes bacterium ADurb.BinA052]|nr:MAG: hypothetical protein BWY92_01251 [Firmicutes bacterium ADurb.BinA052]
MGLDQEGTRPARRVVDRLAAAGGLAHANDLGHHSGDLRRGVELPLALARLGGEVLHEVLVRIAQEIVVLRPVAPEVQLGLVKHGHEIGQAVDHLLAPAQLAVVVEVGLVDDPLEVVGFGQPGNDLVDLVADLLIALQRQDVVVARARRHLHQRVLLGGVLVRHVLHEQQDKHVVLIL